MTNHGMTTIALNEQEKHTRKEQILEAFRFRHATKVFDADRKIPAEDFDFILETGRLSPSSFGYEPWKFVVLQNPAIREELKAVTWGAQGTLPTASHFLLILARSSEQVRHGSAYLDYMNREVLKLPEKAEEGRKAMFRDFQVRDFGLMEHPRQLEDWAAKQTYIALGNMMTSAAQIGIDSCPIEGFHKEKAEALLREHGILGDEFSLSVMAAFGYRVQEPREKIRRCADEVVKWV
ncbi:NAD(P)H-dependent oxidoreductase [Paenibacillus pasadenensis]|uniref:NAD(P)H-dependent oxidoreductase n=1 Tax=Paenibacillus pasadenensis TaxID=217090 RepID=UPI00203BD61B|nr:NAD(P)H-dependent oxidoreductase [Paenibacillus pasadenensis]MCM3746469.1 NAD(P)H-dependent oxidoreductase [Paenibacillus pasadenensis]